MRKRLVGALAAAGLALAGVAPGWSQSSDYPNDTVRILVGFSAGGATDVLARALAEGLTEELGQPFIVENRAGASGAVAAQELAQSDPDGYTLMVTAGSAMTINVHMPPKPPYDPLKDFQTISQLVSNDGVLAVSNDLPVKNMEEFIAYAKEHPGELSYGVSGIGSPTHLGTELLKDQLGIEMTHVPYQGDAKVAVDVIAGTLPVGVMALPSVVGQLQDGQMRPIAVLGTTSYEDFPGVPNVAELGYPENTVQTWLGLIGPAGMPEDIVQTLSEATQKVMASEDMTSLMAAQNSRIVASTPEEFADYMAEEYEKWGSVVKSLGLDKKQ